MTPQTDNARKNRGRGLGRHLPFVLLFLTAAVMGIATLIENTRGTAFIHATIYGAAWFKGLWAAVVAAALWWMWPARLYRRVAVLTLHLSLILILLGGLVTAITHQSGILHLRQGLTESRFLSEDKHFIDLPFSVRLDTFYIQHYPGTTAPQDYVSRITISPISKSTRDDAAGRMEAAVSMNRIHHQSGYRLYQSSYDPDTLGSWLTVTYDPYGSPIAYAGFLLFGLSAIAVLIGKRNGFRSLLRQFTAATAMFLLPIASYGSTASTGKIPCIPREQADSMATRLVVWNDRVCPFNTLATDFVKKIYGKRTCKGYTPEQVAASWMRYPDIWNRAPLIKVKSAALRQRLGMTDSHCSFASLYDSEGRYRLQPLWDAETDKHSKLAQAIQQTDEKVGLIAMLLGGTLIKDPETAVTLSPMRIRAELLYNRVPFVSILFMANLTLGFIVMLLLIIQPAHNRTSNRHNGQRRLFPAHYFLHLLITLSLLTLIFAYGLRWYISGRIPLANGFETMMFAAMVVQAVALVLMRRMPLTAPFGFLLSGFLLLVAHLGYMNPQITSLMPVLNSPWLSSHVSIIMISYALLGFTFMSALVAVWLPETDPRCRQLTLLSRLLLHPAVLLLCVGIFLGAVWANVSWGTYWSWDPKEVWALITAIVYAVPLHAQLLPWLRRTRPFNIYMLFAFLTVLMTYFGVNFLLGGMHSYAN